MVLQILADFAKAVILGVAAAGMIAAAASFSRAEGIDGPETVEAGELAVFRSVEPGAWAIYPDVPFEVDSAENKMVFASPKKGEFTIFFCSIVDGKPVIQKFTFVNGADVSPSPDPEPKPEPAKVTESEKETLVWAVESVLKHIEEGTIRTPQGVRATFKSAVSARIQDPSVGLSLLLDDWTERTDWANIETVRNSFTGFLKEVQE